MGCFSVVSIMKVRTVLIFFSCLFRFLFTGFLHSTSQSTVAPGLNLLCFVNPCLTSCTFLALLNNFLPLFLHLKTIYCILGCYIKKKDKCSKKTHVAFKLQIQIYVFFVALYRSSPASFSTYMKVFCPLINTVLFLWINTMSIHA